MIPRQAEGQILERLRSYPAVALIGPRQCGKTTLAQSFDGAYFDLEQESDRLRLDLSWDDLVSGKRLAILDEAQVWPEVFPRLRGAIDSDRKRKGRFLLLGSVSPALMTQVSESLAGRLSLFELTPLLLSELIGKSSLERRWLYGGYPDGGVLDRKQYPRWGLDYMALLAQRDLPTWGLPAKPATTDRFIRMLAALHGQAWNASQIGQSLGLSYHTVNDYLDYLTGAFLIRKLQPYQANVKKRLVKRPKIYWRDSGLLHTLLNVPDRRALLSQPWVGASWEGFVIQEVAGVLSSAGRRAECHYFRTSDGHELDLVLDFGTELWAVDIKLTSSPSPDDMGRLEKTAKTIGAAKCFLVSQTRRPARSQSRFSCNLPSFIEHLLEVGR